MQTNKHTPICHGCKNNYWSAPDGQVGRPEPHSRCKLLMVYVPMILGEHKKWIGSEVPAECPTPTAAGRD